MVASNTRCKMEERVVRLGGQSLRAMLDENRYQLLLVCRLSGKVVDTERQPDEMSRRTKRLTMRQATNQRPPNNDMHRSRRRAVRVVTGEAVRRPGDVER